MSWRCRCDEDELPILRGLVDEILCKAEEMEQSTNRFLREVGAELKKTIWESNNEPKNDGSPIWWPRHETINGNICLIEEILDENQEPIKMRVKHEY